MISTAAVFDKKLIKIDFYKFITTVDKKLNNIVSQVKDDNVDINNIEQQKEKLINYIDSN